MAKARAQAENTELDVIPTETMRDVSRNERFSNKELRSVDSFEAAMQLAAQAYGNVLSVTDDELELGNGFRILPDRDKSRLVGISFVILHFQFNEGDFGDFVSVTLVTQNNDRLVMNDGSTGVMEQLREVAATGRYGGVAVPHGLRASEYATCAECGKPRKPSETTCDTCSDVSEKRAKGVTYYLDVTE